MESWIGIVIAKNELTLVRLAVSEKLGRVEVVDDRTLKLQAGSRGVAYRKAQEWVVTYLRELGPQRVTIKGSALPRQGSPKLGLLEGAEFRGAIMAGIVESGCKLEVSKKASLSKSFGDRKVDAYVKDDTFWGQNFTGKLRKGSREAALMAYATVQRHGSL